MSDYTCFVISPIGDAGTDIREEADSALEYLIIPALRNCGFDKKNIIRADQLVTTGRIDADIIRLVRDSDLCIIDVTGLNPNVMYECGMRHGNGKPYIMIAQKNQRLPFDISGIRTIMYDLSSLRSAKASLDILEKYVSALSESGFARDAGTDSISSIADTVRNLEKKVDMLVSNQIKNSHPVTVMNQDGSVEQVLSHLSPIQAFNYALAKRDSQLAEALLPKIKAEVSEDYYIERAISQAAAIGSKYAAMYIKENWIYIVDHLSVNTQYDCLGSFVSYCNRADLEEENLEFFNKCFETMLRNRPDNQIKSGLYNQRNRIYFGAYTSGGKQNEQYYTEALSSVNMAISLNPNEASYYFNLATILNETDLHGAANAMEKCLDLDEDADDDHLLMAYKIFDKIGNARAQEAYQKLSELNPYLAFMAKR